MGKPRAPLPPTPAAASRLKTPMKPTVARKNSAPNLSLVAAYDDLMRNSSVFHNGAEEKFLTFVKIAKDMRRKWEHAETERQRLNIEINTMEKQLAVKDQKIRQAQQMVNVEMRERARIEHDRDSLQRQWFALQEMVNSDGAKNITNETLQSIRNQISPNVRNNVNVQRTPSAKRNYFNKENMTPLVEQSQESIIDASELDFDDDSRDGLLDGSRLRSGQVHNGRRSSNGPQRRKSRRSHSMGGDKIIATTTLTVDKKGHAHAQAVLESQAATVAELQEKVKKMRKSRENFVSFDPQPSAPPLNMMNTPTAGTPSVKRTFSNAGTMPTRQHNFVQKKNLSGKDKCAPCDKKLKFGKTCLKCQDCGVACHPECKLDVPLPCIRGVNRTPTNKQGNFLANYTPMEHPMVPPLLVVCVREIEERGLDEVGLYRVPGNESDSNEILDKLMSSKGQTPNLSKYEIHAVTSCVKKFLRSLKEPVIPLSLWNVFVDAACHSDNPDAAIIQAISELPLPNRDTLAYLMIHFQTVAENYSTNKMGKDNVSLVLAPTIVGNSSSDPMAQLYEKDSQMKVMTTLMAISSDFWIKFLEQNEQNIFGYMHHNKVTPEVSNRMFAPVSNYSPLNPTPVAPNPRTGGPAKRTRSKQTNIDKKPLFQSPMIF